MVSWNATRRRKKREAFEAAIVPFEDTDRGKEWAAIIERTHRRARYRQRQERRVLARILLAQRRLEQRAATGDE